MWQRDLKAMPKKKNEQTKKETKKQANAQQKVCHKKLYVGAWKEMRGRRGLWPGTAPQCPSKFAAHRMRIEFILFRTPSSSFLSPTSPHRLVPPCPPTVPGAGLRCCPYQPKSETFRAQLPSKSRVTVCRASDSEPFRLNFLYASHSLACLLSFCEHLKLFQNFSPSPNSQFQLVLLFQSPNGNLSHSAPKLPEIEIKNLTKRLVFPLSPPPLGQFIWPSPINNNSSVERTILT